MGENSESEAAVAQPLDEVPETVVVEPDGPFESTLTAALWRAGFGVSRQLSVEAGIAAAGSSRALVVSARMDAATMLDAIEAAVSSGRLRPGLVVLVGPTGDSDAMTRTLSCGLAAYVAGKKAAETVPDLVRRVTRAA